MYKDFVQIHIYLCMKSIFSYGLQTLNIRKASLDNVCLDIDDIVPEFVDYWHNDCSLETTMLISFLVSYVS